MPASETRFRLYDARQLEPVIRRMARQIADRLDGEPVVLVGLLRRGVPLAERIAAALAQLPDAPSVIRRDLAVKRYGDDLTLLHPDTRLEDAGEAGEPAGPVLAGSHVVLVDDVLYQGHSMARVLEWARAHGAASITAAVLVDRMVRRLAVCADVVGLRLQIAPDDVIECNVPPYETEFAIDLMRLPPAHG